MANDERTGSEAVYKFLVGRQPRLALHGRLHESPEIGGIGTLMESLSASSQDRVNTD